MMRHGNEKKFFLITGISGSGKSSYCLHLQEKHGFHHVDTDKDVGRIEEAVRSNPGLVARYLDQYHKVAWEWGFLPQFLGCMLWLKAQQAKLLWFKAGPGVARSLYLKAHPEDPTGLYWDAQMQRIVNSCLPTPDFQVVETFRDGRFRSYGEIDIEILGPSESSRVHTSHVVAQCAFSRE